ncbi:TraY domain-containing protein [Legionella saoudiensis]|uniref:TraY domain-containing protein n=1 Tax=Legionella saoudiensis TaxID=1750561 RepID=UPI00098EC7F2|nr:TraY domain-containing protein [Legionella saoudiensis]
MESDINYEKVYITLRLSASSNKLLSESAIRSKRKKVQEAILRLEHHLSNYVSVSEYGPIDNQLVDVE